MDVAKKQTETAFKQLEVEFSSMDNLLKANPVDPEAISLQLQDLDVEIGNYFTRQDAYIELLINNNVDDLYDDEEATRKQVRKKRNSIVNTISKVCKAAVMSPGASSQPTSGTASSSSYYHAKYPKRELPKFSGDVRQWRSFWAQFQEIDNDSTIPVIGKYNYLLQCMADGSSAHKVVSSFPPADTSYELAKKELEHRFGRKKTLIKVYVRDLLALVVDNAKEKKSDTFVDVVTKLQSQILNLEQLGVTQDKYGELLYPIIESCIPVDVLNRYLDQPGVKEELTEIMEYLRNEVRRKEESARAQSAFGNEKEDKRPKGSDKPKDKSTTPTATNFMDAHQKSGNQCGFCGGNHATADCRKAVSMTIDERKESLKKSATCFKCLKGGHTSKKCTNKLLCIKCKKNHHTLMCFDKEPTPRVDQLNLNSNQGESRNWRDDHNKFQHQQFYGGNSSSVARPSADMANYIRKPEVLLQTLLIQVHSPRGFYRTVRAMFDSGSQASYIKQSLAEELKLTAEGKELVVHQTFGGAVSKEVEHPIVRLEVSGINEPYLHRYRFQSSVVPKIAENIVAVPSGPWIKECAAAGIPLTDIIDASNGIDVLIGNDISPYLKVEMKSTRLASGVIATESKLGWFLEGKIPGSEKKRSTKAMMCVNMMMTDKEVENLWALETIGIRDASENRTKAELEEAALSHFMKTVRRDEDGRYEVHLPWIEGHPSLPDNKRQVFARLEKTTKDLVRDGYLDQYDTIFKDWEADGIIERVPENPTPSSVIHYLGHRAVYKEGSTTPVRPVFNASAKTKLSPSLNECLAAGPNTLEKIPTVLSNFRMEKIGVVSDIKKAFLQLKVTEQHRDCLRFPWWENINDRKQIMEYRHCRVVFGVSSSPFLLGAAIQHLLIENASKFPETIKKLGSSFYVDNCVASHSSLEKAIQFKKEAQEVFLSAQMDLRGWEYGPSSEEKTVPVLGLLWNTKSDCLSYDLKGMLKKLESTCTKRSVLQLANSLYDPLGIISPFVIVIKIIFKCVCGDARKFSWDEELPEEYAKEFNAWKQQLPSLHSLNIPRCITRGSVSRQDWSIHVMSDASKESYACCIYLRINGSPVNVQLIQARARVTPQKVVTIPRAELLGCLIAARLYNQVVEDLKVADIPVTFWTDSSTALIWITKIDAVWGTFVNRRVKEIRNLTDVSCWRHVPGEMNPADLPSRGSTFEKYEKLRWWEGPEWLRGPVSQFPNSLPEADQDEVCQEKRKTVVSALTQSQDLHFLDGMVRLGDWHRILRVAVYMLRFIKKIRRTTHRNETSPAISKVEIDAAEHMIIVHIQRSTFVTQLPTSMRTVKDELGVIRVETKLVGGDDDANFKYPILLPGDNLLVRQLIFKEHCIASHGGIQYMMSIIRQKYWITNARRSIKAVINKCSICRVHRAKKCQVMEAPLPMNRIKTTRCFAVCGIDLAGPLLLKDGQKVWVVLFTCAVYRAVHLELVTSLSTEAFLVALRKFVVRRGRPSTIYSDNGTNFIGAHNLFRKINWDEVVQYAAVTRIEWIHNPPTAAWWGGWWERLVGLMKQLLRRVLGSRCVEYNELEVLVLEVETVLNERPLTYVSEDPSDLTPLTPSMFLRDLPLACLPEADVGERQLRKNLHHVQRLREQLRSRFQREYLAQLVHRGKVTRSDVLAVGDVVLVETDNQKRIQWPIGVILELYPGRDGVTRTAKVRTTSGEILRPFQRLYPLEVNQTMNEELKPMSRRTPKVENPVEAETQEENDEVPEELLDHDPEPIVVTKSGRRIMKPLRLGIN